MKVARNILLSIFTLFFSLSVTAQQESMTQKVKLETTEGNIVVELYPNKAPISVENFLYYVTSGYYDGTIFHRVIPNFMIQVGGFTDGFAKKSGAKPPIRNEADNKLHNLRGTLAMARTNDPHSATSQFFINVVDNNFLDQNSQSYGYAVFGKVLEGMDIVDKISLTKTGQKAGMSDVPMSTITITKASAVNDEVVEK